MGAGDTNSGPDVCSASTLLAEPYIQTIALFLTVTYHWLLIMLPSYSECSLKCWCMHLCLVTLEAYLASLDSGSLHVSPPLWPGHCDNLLSRNQEWQHMACKLSFCSLPPHPCATVVKLSFFHHFTGCQWRKQSKPINLEMLPLTNQKLSLLSQLP